jgi:hypothetical protein
VRRNEVCGGELAGGPEPLLNMKLLHRIMISEVRRAIQDFLRGTIVGAGN